MTTHTGCSPTHTQDSPIGAQHLPTQAPTPHPETSWPEMPTCLDGYYHDYRIYSQDGQPLFVSAALTECSMDPNHSHETILPNTCPHKTPLLYLELTLATWNNPIFHERTGRSSYLRWDSNLDVKSLTRLNFKSLTDHVIVSTPGRVFTARPSAVFGLCPSFDDSLIYPEGLDRALPIFRPTDSAIATHLFVKIPWRPKKSSPKRLEITRFTPLPGLHYWCAINDHYRIGVDYWLVPLAEKPPAPESISLPSPESPL